MKCPLLRLIFVESKVPLVKLIEDGFSNYF